MGRAPCCDKAKVKKGPWSPEEDAKLKEYIDKCGTSGNWISLPQRAGLQRCGKSCRLRWLNYLRPDIKHGQFSDDEDRVICSLFANIGSRWSIIAAQLPGRTDNDIKNYWNTKLKKKLMGMLSPSSNMQQPLQSQIFSPFQNVSTYEQTSITHHHHLAVATKSVSSFQDMSIPSNLTFEGLVSPMHHRHYPGKDSLAIFGGEPSSSSSDGGLSPPNGDQTRLESYFCNGVEENQQLMLCGGSEWNEKPIRNRWFSGETALEYELEEIRRLVTTNDANNLFTDETKEQSRVIM